MRGTPSLRELALMPSSPETKITAATLQYAGFWRRNWAMSLDTLLLLPLAFVLHWATYARSPYSWINPAPTGSGILLVDYLVQFLAPFLITVLFWVSLGATPGKMALSVEVVDARTGGPITAGQAVIRYLGYVVSSLPLLLGFFWAAWDPKKQTWHDKMAGTVVVFRDSDHTAHFEG